MKILILGGTAFTGPYIARSLAANGHDLSLYHRGTQDANLPPTATPIRHIHDDLANLPVHGHTLRSTAFDVVLHMMAMTKRDAELALGTFAGHAGRIVVASSQDVYAPFGALLKKEAREPTSLPINEDSPVRNSRRIHGGDYEKLDVEETFLANADRLPATVLRMPPTYGPHDPRHRFFPYLKRIDDRRPAILLDPSHGNFKWSHGYVENVAHAFTLAITNDAATNKIYNVGEGPQGRTPTVAERLHELARAAKYRGQILIVPRDQCPPHLLHEDIDFRHDLIINDAAIRRELGYTEIVPAEEAFRRTIAWQRENPPDAVNPAEFNYEAENQVLKAFGLLRPGQNAPAT